MTVGIQRSGSLSTGYLKLLRSAGEPELQRASGCEPGACDNQQEAGGGSDGELLTEHHHAKENGDGRIDITDHHAASGPHFLDEREEDWQGQGSADQTENEQAC